MISAAAVLVSGGVRRLALAEQPPVRPVMGKPLEQVRLEDDLVVLVGAGGNVTVHFDSRRLLVIDSGVPDRGADVLATALNLAPATSRKTLLNTHWHFDHVGGNGEFAQAGFTIVSHENCRKWLAQDMAFEDLQMQFAALPEASRPEVTFGEHLTLHEASTVRLIRHAPAHTDNDVYAFLEKYNVLITGDLHFSGAFPVIDRTTGGSLDGMIASTKTLLAVGDEKTRVVPGHGPVGEKSALQAQLGLLELTRERLAPFGERKASMDEVLATKPLADLDDKWGRGFLRSPVFTRMAYGQWVKP